MAIMVSTLSSMADIVKDAAHRAVFKDMPKPPQITNLLSQIQQSLEEPLDAVQIAQAYRSSQDLSSNFSDDRCMHLVMLLLRDLLLLRVCMDHGNWSNHLLQQELTNVFNGSSLSLKLPEKELSRLLLAFNKIMTFGKSREEFDKNLGLSGQDVPLGEETPSKKKHPYINLKPTQLDHIFAAFSACAGASPEYRSNNEKKRKPGKKRKRSQKQRHVGMAASRTMSHRLEGFLPHRTILSTAARWSRVSVMTVECWMPWKRICRGCSMSCPF